MHIINKTRNSGQEEEATKKLELLKLAKAVSKVKKKKSLDGLNSRNDRGWRLKRPFSKPVIAEKIRTGSEQHYQPP